MTDGTGADPDLEPEEPAEAGVSEAEPDVSHIEAARLLADQAKERLEAQGFDQEEIRKWAEAYTRERESGDVDDLVEWIAHQERTG